MAASLPAQRGGSRSSLAAALASAPGSAPKSARPPPPRAPPAAPILRRGCSAPGCAPLPPAPPWPAPPRPRPPGCPSRPGPDGPFAEGRAPTTSPGEAAVTTPLFATDAYLREFEARVTSVTPDGQGVVLDRTAFYPGGGGQPCDAGVLVAGEHRIPATRVRREGEEIVHEAAGTAPWTPGAGVTGLLDWDRRHALMRTHTALHVLCGVVWRDWKAAVTGGSMEPLTGRLDFEFESLHQGPRGRRSRPAAAGGRRRPRRPGTGPPRGEDAFRIPDLIRTKVNLLPPHVQDVRTVEIVGLDLQGDGGSARPQHARDRRDPGDGLQVEGRDQQADLPGSRLRRGRARGRRSPPPVLVPHEDEDRLRPLPELQPVADQAPRVHLLQGLQGSSAPGPSSAGFPVSSCC